MHEGKNAQTNWQNALIKIKVWFTHDKYGNEFTVIDRQLGKNCKPIPIHDFFLTDKGSWYCNQRMCIDKTKLWLSQNENKIISAMVYLRHRKLRKEYLIGKFVNTKGFEFFCEPQYIKHKNGSVYVDTKDFNHAGEFNFSEDLHKSKT